MPFPTLAPFIRASRSLRRAPGFVAIATLSLGAALGLSTSVFALIDAMRHPASPYRDVGALYEVWIFRHSKLGPSRREVEEAIAGIPGVERLATADFDMFAVVETASDAEQNRVVRPRPGFWEVLGVRPRLGRLPSPGEAKAASVAVVSDAFWRRKFDNRSRINGETFSIGDRRYSIIGVLPNGANAPLGMDIWIPDPAPDAGSLGLPIVRLRRGDADTLQVNTHLKTVMERFTRAYGGPREAPFAAQLRSVRPDPLTLKDFHLAMVGAALCVLLIACANVSALMLARGVVRRRDFALRLALGATRSEIAREVLTEIAILAFIGCVAGAMIATWAVGLMTRSTPEEMSWYGFVQPQWSVRVLAMSAGALFVSVAVAGGFPAWQASRTDPAGLLKESSSGNTSRAGTLFRWLVMAELALAMTLVLGATLMLKSATLLARYDFGYDARSVLVAETWIWGPRDSASTADNSRQFMDALARVRALPEVRNAALHLGCTADRDVVSSDRTAEGGASAFIPNGCTNVSAGFFATLGIPIVDGRDFAEGDALAGGTAIIDQKTARLLFRNERAVGRMLKLGDMASREPWMRIVGVVRNQPLAFNSHPEAGPDTSTHIYVSLPTTSARLQSERRVELIVRPRAGASATGIAVARALRAALPSRSHVWMRPWTSSYEDVLKEERYLSLLFSLLGIASLALGAAGLFGVVSYIASQRMREFAVRMALGATRENLLRLVMRDALAMALGGTAVGAGLGMWAGFLLWDKMWGVYPVDAGALVAAEVTLLLVTLLACLAPALRAARADPVDVMRAT